ARVASTLDWGRWQPAQTGTLLPTVIAPWLARGRHRRHPHARRPRPGWQLAPRDRRRHHGRSHRHPSSRKSAANMMAGIVLAAGEGRRMGGRPKAGILLHGATLLEHTVRSLRRGGCIDI